MSLSLLKKKVVGGCVYAGMGAVPASVQGSFFDRDHARSEWLMIEEGWW